MPGKLLIDLRKARGEGRNDAGGIIQELKFKRQGAHRLEIRGRERNGFLDKQGEVGGLTTGAVDEVAIILRRLVLRQKDPVDVLIETQLRDRQQGDCQDDQENERRDTWVAHGPKPGPFQTKAGRHACLNQESDLPLVRIRKTGIIDRSVIINQLTTEAASLSFVAQLVRSAAYVRFATIRT